MKNEELFIGCHVDLLKEELDKVSIVHEEVDVTCGIYNR
jgi:hypothetical protein